MAPDELKNLHRDARPRLSWRVGVTGHRDLAAADLQALEQAVDAVFGDVALALAAVQKRPDAAKIFAPGPPLIALISPLAEGADTLCANLALKRGFELRAPLPFARDEYRRDFAGAAAADFDRLLQKAEAGGVVELDGRPEPGEPRNRAYMAVGEFVIRNCDLLIAIWDGEDARGLGGTGDVVERARQCGVPVVHIHSKNPTQTTIRETAGSTAAYSSAGLGVSIEQQIIPKVRAPRHHDGGLGAKKDPSLAEAERYFCKERLADTGREPDFLYEGPFATRMPALLNALASLFPWFSWLLGKRVAVDEPVKTDPPWNKTEENTRFLFLHYQRADTLATFYSNVHRSAFLLVYLMGALALSFAVAALFTYHAAYFYTGLELVVLIVLALIVLMDNNLRWRDRWLEYRLLAELLREADLLAHIGRPMPIGKIDELAQDLPGRAWVTIAYCAIVRRAGLPTQRFDAAHVARLRDYTVATRLQDQIAYHRRAEARNESIANVLRYVGLIAFGGTALVALMKLTLSGIADRLAAGLLAGVLPAFAYACFGIRNQAEFEIVSRRSERMVVKLTRLQERMKALKGDALTSDALGREILQAAAVMRHDAADWTSIFEVKETET